MQLASKQTDAKFLNAPNMECVTDTVVGYPISREIAARFEAPFCSLPIMASSEISNIFGENIDSPSIT